MESQPQNPEFRIFPETFHPWECVYELAHAILLCITLSSKEGSGEPAPKQKLTRAFPACKHKVLMKKKANTKI